jgi:rSAM/selenodomain-associated transferase 2
MAENSAPPHANNLTEMTVPPRISVVIPTLNAESGLAAAIGSVCDGAAEIIVADGGSTDSTRDVALAGGARIVASDKGRGLQLYTGGAAATADWILFLHADTRLSGGWEAEVAAFAADLVNAERAAVFTLSLDDASPQARRMERLVGWRTRRLGLPYGDQGLLISRDFYHRLGGFRTIPLMEDVEIVRRISRKNIIVLETRAVTSAIRYRQGGWWGRPVRNIVCLMLYFLGVPPRTLARIYR